MKHSLLNLLSSALVPILCADIATGTSCNVHLCLIAIAAMRTFPNELAVIVIRDLDLTVKAANLAIVALGIELGVHNVVVDEFHNSEHSVDIVLHIGNLDVRDCAAGRELLELSLERKLCERIDRLGNVYVVGVGDVIFIGNTLNDTEAVLQPLSKLVGSALKGSAVETLVTALERSAQGNVRVRPIFGGVPHRKQLKELRK